MQHIALILAGGSGSRMGGALPKQLLPLNGKAALLYTLEAFDQHPEIDGLCLVVPKAWRAEHEQLLETAALRHTPLLINGGDTRQESSFLGLLALEKHYSPTDAVLIHDAARPLVSARLISDCIRATAEHPGCTAALPLQDSILESSDGKTICAFPDRSRFYLVQTPQAFRLESILAGHRALPKNAAVTDDASVLRQAGLPVALVLGEKNNLKLTSPEDMRFAEFLLSGEASSHK